MMLKTILEDVKIRRPNSCDSTRLQHSRTLAKIYQDCFPLEKEFKPELFETCESHILMSCVPEGTSTANHKRYAAALGIYTRRPELVQIISDANQIYRDRVNNYISTHSEEVNRMLKSDIENLDERLFENYKLGSPPHVRRYVLWCLVSGKYIAPRRAKDWILFKIRNIHPDKDNYLDHNTRSIVFNNYKTAHIYGRDAVRIPDVLYDLIVEYSSTVPCDYMFHTRCGGHLSGAAFNSLVNSLSTNNKGHGVNQYRKTYLQNKFGTIVDIQDTMRAMGSSTGSLNSYIRNI